MRDLSYTKTMKTILVDYENNIIGLSQIFYSEFKFCFEFLGEKMTFSFELLYNQEN